MGFYHTPPVIPKYFTEQDFSTFSRILVSVHIKADQSTTGTNFRLQKSVNGTARLQSILNICGYPLPDENHPDYQPVGVEGALVGWSPFQLQAIYG
jgi:hypothetical protein